MKTIWRHSWIWIVAVISLALPPWLAIANRTQGFHQHISEIIGAICTTMEQKFGPGRYEEFTLLTDVNLTANEMNVQIPAIDLLASAPSLGDAPAAQPQIDWVRQDAGPFLERMMEFREKNNNEAYVWNCPTGTVPQRNINYLKIQVGSKLHRVFALDAAGEGNWNEAIREAENSARIGDPVRTNHLIGHLINLATRSIGYGTFERLLQENPDAETSREIAHVLSELNASNPRLHPVQGAMDSADGLAYLARPENDLFVPQFISEMNLVGGALLLTGKRAEEVESNHDRRWLKRKLETSGDMGWTSRGTLSSIALPWTRLDATAQRLRHIVRNNPTLLDDIPAYLEIVKDIPESDRLFLVFGASHYHSEFLERTRITHTRGYLVQAAYASRVYYLENGHWPDSLEDLDRNLFSPLPEGSENYFDEQLFTQETLEAQVPYGPLRMEWQIADNDFMENLVNRYVGDRLAIFQAQVHIESQSPRNATMEVDKRSIDYPEIRAAFLTQSVESDPEGLIASVRLLDVSGNKPVELDVDTLLALGYREIRNKIAIGILKEMTPEYEKKLESIRTSQDLQNLRADQVINAAMIRNLDELKAIYDSRDTNRPRPEKIRLEMTLNRPDKVFAIWSPGPDGIDEGGRVVYDPTNGTISGGDIVVYPEGY